MDHRKNMPANRVSAQEVRKKPSNIPQSVRLVTVDGVIVFPKGLLK
jgi:hypothetical protein